MVRKPCHEDMERRVRELEEKLSEAARREESLQIEKAYLEHLLDDAPEAIALADKDHRITRTNAQFARLFGYTPEEARGRFADDLIAPGDRTVEASEITHRVGHGEPVRIETVRYRKDGSPVFVELMAAPVRAGEEHVGDYASYRDITERKLAEAALRESEERLRQAQEIARLGRWEMDLRTNWLHWSDGIFEIFEIEREKFGASYDAFLDAIHPDDRAAVSTAYAESLRNRTPYEISHRLLMKDGRIRWVNEICRTEYDSEGRPIRSVGTVQDITELKRAEEALRASEARFRFLVEDSPFGISFMHGDRTFEFFNRKFTEIFGYAKEDLPDKQTWFEKAYPDPAYRENVISVWSSDSASSRVSGEVKPRVFTVRCKDGKDKIIHFRAVTARDGAQFLTYEDITEKTKLEAQFQAYQRLESLGTLAGGIAHDFNNLLMGIQGRASLMLMDMDSSHPLYEHLRGIEEHVKSAADLTRQLLGFARGGKYEVKPSDLNELVKRSSAMFGRTRKEIRIHERYQDPVWIVEVDQGQIQQVLMNLYVNAWQAMPGGGDLYLETENVVLDELYEKGFNVNPGRYVRISVTDTGVGMDEKTKARLFDPFFTTKEMGRGTGLGLASSYGIVKNHGGIITVYSERGAGTSFHIYLPASDKELVGTRKWDAALRRGHETVLLVDDEEHVLDVGGQMLEKLGYHVLTAGGGANAVEAMEANRSRIDLVILDMIMPDMGGGEAFDRMKEINPDVRVLLSSGYSINGQAQRILDRGCRGFIQKPFNMMELSQKVRESLDKGRDA
ncbi:MAG: PAS domain S-box protein [Deltaproteobacteria bacterium]|nr:PAS domain S-box protein [Deltaproteobacteria bacterium]